MDENLYDEFGNYIGDSEDSDAESQYDVSENEQLQDADSEMKEEKEKKEDDLNQAQSQQIILHEDKKYHPTISETFGPDVEVTLQTSDAQTINDPLVKPLTQKKIIVEEKHLPKISFSRDYLVNLSLNVPDRIRNISLVGNLHSGKTTFLDMLILQTHPNLIEENKHLQTKNFKSLRYSDNHKLEIERGLSIKTSAASLLLPNLKGKSLVVNVFDSPGHINFTDELAVAQRLSDASILILDVVEGLTIVGKLAIENAIKNSIQLNVVLNKIDRLILELKLPILDAYYKIRHVIEEINHYIKSDLEEYLSDYPYPSVFSPEANNVSFSSGKLQFIFNLKSFAQKYLDLNGLSDVIDVEQFSKRMWGDQICYNNKTGKFYKKSSNELSSKNTFIQFVLEPLYKIFSVSISKDHKELSQLLYENFHISLEKKFYKQDSQVLLTKVCREFFNNNYGFVDMIENSVDAPLVSAQNKVGKVFDAPQYLLKDLEVAKAFTGCSSDNITIANIVKLINTQGGEQFYGLTRVYSGSLEVGHTVKILNESYSYPDNTDDYIEFEIKELFIPCARYNFEVNKVAAGGICLIGGEISHYVNKTATIYGGILENEMPLFPFKKVDYLFDSIFKVSIKPDLPSHLPELLSSLQSTNKSYVGADVKVEESGEYIISGSGELYMDCLLYDIRYFYADKLEIKVSEPFVRFQETVEDKSMAKLTVTSLNGKNSISILCEPLESDLAKDLRDGKLNDYKQLTKRQVAKVFQNLYGWDPLAARSIWRIGPDANETNILIDDTLPEEVDKTKIESIKDFIIQGFNWATKQGPLCDETIANVKFRIIAVELSDNMFEKSSGQIMPMVRNACYGSFLISTPRLLEPIYEVSITCTKNSTEAVRKILLRRRGVLSDSEPIVATQLYRCVGYIPVLDSVGFETDLRLLTQGQAMCLLRFHEWGIASGDPLDKDAFIPKLKPAAESSLARDLVIKTRRKKGLTGEPNLEKYVDIETVEDLREKGIID